MRLGRYELGRVLGRGGQGRVHEAVQHGPGGYRRTVALKLMADGAGLTREARLGGLLRHPHIVDVYEVGEADGTWFLAMACCPDGSLADHLPLSPRAVVEAGLQVCAALSYAHEELGLVHLDLKPENLLLDGPIVKVADLGIARGDGVAPRVRVEGTAGYMAPERARGIADARADVYALGVVLRELATGERPEGRSGSDTVSLDRWDATPPPVPERDAVAWLEPVVARCLAFDPAERFPSMAALAEALRGLPVTGPSLAELVPPRTGHDRPAADPELPLIGREADLEAVASRLGRPGLVTVKGPPGIGKTALARAAAARYAAEGRVAEWFVDLSDGHTLVDVVAAVATALEVPLGPGSDDALVAQVGRALASRGPAVVVLDNVEQVAARAAVFSRWLEAAPELRLLATSRVALRVVGEAVVELGALDEAAAAAMIRAVALRRGVELGADPLVTTLARRLDGVPLALELAAGRLGVLPLAEVVERLSLSLLRTGRPGMTDREATLRGALQWSFDLLDAPARAALGQLSVFRGGFPLEAAEEVLDLGADAVPIEVLATLVDHSLVVTREQRFHLLAGVREFAAESLGAAPAVERRHGRWVARLGRPEALEALDGHGGTTHRAALGLELGNLEVACRRAVAAGDAAIAVPTLRAAWEVLEYRGPFEAAIELGLSVAALPLSPAQQGVVALVVGRALVLVGRGSEAATHFEGALQVATTAGDVRGIAVARAALGNLALDHGRADEARVHLEAARATFHALGERRLEAMTRLHLGNGSLRQGRLDEAAEHYAGCRAAAVAVGSRRYEALAAENLGIVWLHRGSLREARELFEHALAEYVAIGDRRCETSVRLNLANLLTNLGSPDESRAQFEAALRVARDLGDRRNEGRVLANFGLHPLYNSRPREALPMFLAALAIHREVHDRFSEGVALCNLGRTHVELGQVAEARAYFEAALELNEQVGNRRFQALVSAILAPTVADTQPERARALLDRADELVAASGGPADRCSVAIGRAEVCWRLGEDAAADRALDQARALAQGRPALLWELDRAMARRPRA